TAGGGVEAGARAGRPGRAWPSIAGPLDAEVWPVLDRVADRPCPAAHERAVVAGGEDLPLGVAAEDPQRRVQGQERRLAHAGRHLDDDLLGLALLDPLHGVAHLMGEVLEVCSGDEAGVDFLRDLQRVLPAGLTDLELAGDDFGPALRHRHDAPSSRARNSRGTISRVRLSHCACTSYPARVSSCSMPSRMRRTTPATICPCCSASS